LKTQLVKYI